MTVQAAYNLNSSDTDQRFSLGSIANVDGNTFMYCVADEALTAYMACKVNNDFGAEPLTTTEATSPPIAVVIPQFSVAISEYFWAPCGPFTEYREDGATKFKVLAAQDCANSVALYTTATDGVVDDSSTILIAGLVLTETITTAEAADCIAITKLTCNA